MGENALDQSDCRMHVDRDSWKLKIDWKIFGCVWSKMGVATLVYGNSNWVYLKKELIFGMNCFLEC